MSTAWCPRGDPTQDTHIQRSKGRMARCSSRRFVPAHMRTPARTGSRSDKSVEPVVEPRFITLGWAGQGDLIWGSASRRSNPSRERREKRHSCGIVAVLIRSGAQRFLMSPAGMQLGINGGVVSSPAWMTTSRIDCSHRGHEDISRCAEDMQWKQGSTGMWKSKADRRRPGMGGGNAVEKQQQRRSMRFPGEVLCEVSGRTAEGGKIMGMSRE